MTYYIRHTVHILSLPTQYTQLTRYKCILRLCSFIYSKEIKYESSNGELCVFNRHPGGRVYHMYKTKGPYNLIGYTSQMFYCETFWKIAQWQFSHLQYTTCRCIVLYRFVLSPLFQSSTYTSYLYQGPIV